MILLHFAINIHCWTTVQHLGVKMRKFYTSNYLIQSNYMQACINLTKIILPVRGARSTPYYREINRFLHSYLRACKYMSVTFWLLVSNEWRRHLAQYRPMREHLLTQRLIGRSYWLWCRITHVIQTCVRECAPPYQTKHWSHLEHMRQVNFEKKMQLDIGSKPTLWLAHVTCFI